MITKKIMKRSILIVGWATLVTSYVIMMWTYLYNYIHYRGFFCYDINSLGEAWWEYWLLLFLVIPVTCTIIYLTKKVIKNG